MTGKKLRFIHLSDIHFSNKAAKFGFDPDRNIRTLIVADIAEMRKRLGDADAILVTGDIAFAGQREEFEDAASWLDEICIAAGCSTESVLMCPGNHDVDQSVIRDNSLIQDGHDAVRRGPAHFDRDQALTSRLVQPAARALFYSPIASYNEFAARYQSSFFADTESFAWERDFPLEDGSILRVRGLNSALLSGLADAEGSLFLGTRAWTLPSHPGVEYLVMAHHPPRWLVDGDEADRAFDSGARIHLFGHAHDQRVLPGRDWIKLYAGAVNPHRAEPNWRPGYNIIEVGVSEGTLRSMKVEVHAREWQGLPPQFRAIEDKGNPVFLVDLKLNGLPDSFCAVHALLSKVDEPARSSPGAEVTLAAKETVLLDPHDRFRRIVFRFFRLSLSKKNEIVGHLRLSEESDSRLTDVERFKLSLARAQEREKIDELEVLLTKLERE